MTRSLRFISLLLLTLIFTITACSKKSDDGNQAHLKYIPADSPYVFLSMEPLPKDIREKFSESYESMFKVYSRIASDSYQEYIDRANENKRSNSETGVEVELDEDLWDNKWVLALKEEFKGGFSFEKLENLGITNQSLYAIYGNGVLPVMRISLSDTKLFTDAIERIEKNANDEIPELTVDDMRVWSVSDDREEDGELIIAVDDKDLIITFSPASSSTDMLEQLLGKQLPESSLATTKSLDKIMQEKNYLPHYLGFIDFQQILNRFINEPTGIDAEFFNSFEDFKERRAEISEECKADYASVVANFPRMLLGLTELNSKSMRAEYLFEVRSDIAKDMTKLTADVPGLGEPAGLFSMGFSMNIPEMRDFAIKRIEAIKANPYECEHLLSDTDDLDKMLKTIKNPAAGFVESVRGFNIVLDDLDLDSFMQLMEASEESDEDLDFSEIEELMTEKLSAYAVLAADNPKTMLNMGKMFSPELAALELKADSVPVLINELFPEPVPFEVFAAMNDEALTLSIGKDAETNSKKVLNLKSTTINPLISYSINVEKYLEFFRAMMENPAFSESFEDEQELTAEELESLIQGMLGLSGSATINFNLREDGVAIESDMQF